MRRLFLALAPILFLAGCNVPTLNIASQVNLNTVEGIVSGYGILVNAEIALKSLPLCKTNTNPSASNICVKRSIIVRLQSANRLANVAVNQLVAFVKNNPTVAPSQYISTAQNALAAAEAIVNAAKPPGT
jgi:hypothetical protein